jgi:hypothetical protein
MQKSSGQDRMEEGYVVRFPKSDDATGNMQARDLADFLRDELPLDAGVKATPQRANPEAQDFGATLVLILGTAAVTAVAKGIAAWLKGHTGVTMEIATTTGHVIVKNVESKSAAEIAQAFVDKRKP